MCDLSLHLSIYKSIYYPDLSKRVYLKQWYEMHHRSLAFYVFCFNSYNFAEYWERKNTLFFSPAHNFVFLLEKTQSVKF